MSYEGLIQNGRLDKKFMRKEAHKILLSKRNENWMDYLLDEAEKCGDACIFIYLLLIDFLRYE